MRQNQAGSRGCLRHFDSVPLHLPNVPPRADGELDHAFRVHQRMVVLAFRQDDVEELAEWRAQGMIRFVHERSPVVVDDLDVVLELSGYV